MRDQFAASLLAELVELALALKKEGILSPVRLPVWERERLRERARERARERESESESVTWH